MDEDGTATQKSINKYEKRKKILTFDEQRSPMIRTGSQVSNKSQETQYMLFDGDKDPVEVGSPAYNKKIKNKKSGRLVNF